MTRRDFLICTAAGAMLPWIVTGAASCQTRTRARRGEALVGGGCDGCEAIYEGMPAELTSHTTIAPANEAGERLDISGVIFELDGRTPAANVILYVYHTDAQGYYSPAAGATGLARRDGHLRGWMKTGADGRYAFSTIRPVPYPNRGTPAHIHPVVKEPDTNEYYIDTFVFEDDPLLTRERRSALENRGGSGIVALAKNAAGTWTGTRNIILGLNVPNYA